ncbi:MAG: hypothetical protein ISS15_16965 [Alphaproteobacteria bacterium]|nr:hypothetical protein [Alphaproteobacteria bacterium]MBL6937821.1 hypothetical protein [Alphaproteobacteria bacterium]MBL7099353.1 hypothetical protein [Alphaproteobacteria bacterium]
MDAKNAVETHMRAAERVTMNALAPINEMMAQSRSLFEKSLIAMREETLELLNRLHERNGAILSEVKGGNIAQWTSAHEKWISEFSREMFNASVRFHETARHLMADSIEGVSHSLRNGKIAQAAEDTAAHTAEIAEHNAAAVREAAHFNYHDAPSPTHPEHNA